jgi:hypothetical protein
MSRASVTMPTASATSASCWNRAMMSRLLVDVGHRDLARGVLAGERRVERRVGEQPQRRDALADVGVAAKQLAVLADALRGGLRRRREILGDVGLDAERELDDRRQRRVDVAAREQRRAIARDLRASAPRLQREDRRLDDPAHEEHRRVRQEVQRGGIEDVEVLDVAELVAERGGELLVGELPGEREIDDEVRRVVGAEHLDAEHARVGRRHAEDHRHAHAQVRAGGLRAVVHAAEDLRVAIVGRLRGAREQLGPRAVAPQPRGRLERDRHRPRER